MRQWLKDHGLSLAFASLFVVALLGQSVAGHSSYNSTRSLYGLPAVGYLEYLQTGNFLDGIFTNWQAAILQLGTLIVLGRKLREKGAAHSLKPQAEERQKKDEDGKDRPWAYRNSLSLAFTALFGILFIAHLIFGAKELNERLALIHQPPIAAGQYIVSNAFWFANCQTWEAEFAAIAIYVVLSIFLRQQGSPESKPVDSRDDQTGETNH